MYGVRSRYTVSLLHLSLILLIEFPPHTSLTSLTRSSLICFYLLFSPMEGVSALTWTCILITKAQNNRSHNYLFLQSRAPETVGREVIRTFIGTIYVFLTTSLPSYELFYQYGLVQSHRRIGLSLIYSSSNSTIPY